jgi:hypothetical protein
VAAGVRGREGRDLRVFLEVLGNVALWGDGRMCVVFVMEWPDAPWALLSASSNLR